MNILDENVLEDQRQLLLKWRVPLRQIGYEAGGKGIQDEEIIPFLLGIRRPTLFTLDRASYWRHLCRARSRCGLVTTASFIRGTKAQ